VLERYHTHIVAHAEKVISEGPSARDAIHSWLGAFIPRCSGVKGSRGCLSVNTSADGATDPEVRKRTEAFNRKLEQLLRNRLRADRAQFSDGFNPDAAAHAIIAVYLGLMVLAKDAPEAAGVRATLDQTMKLLS
jgi:TetR/AcrR family transcriptional repressor of nem operon